MMIGTVTIVGLPDGTLSWFLPSGIVTAGKSSFFNRTWALPRLELIFTNVISLSRTFVKGKVLQP